MRKRPINTKSYLRITIGISFGWGMIGASAVQRFGIGWGWIVILAGGIACWSAVRGWWAAWEMNFQNAVMRAQMAQRDSIDLLIEEVGEKEAMMRTIAKETARSIDQDIIDGDPDTIAFLQGKMTPYEAGVDGPLCEKCHHRWCKGDCE